MGSTISAPGFAGVDELAFSRDGAWLLIAGSGLGLQLVRVDDPRQPQGDGILIGHPLDRVRTVAASPDGTAAAEVNFDGMVTLQDIRNFGTNRADDIVAMVCDHASPPMTEIEWARYFPELAYQPPCP